MARKSSKANENGTNVLKGSKIERLIPSDLVEIAVRTISALVEHKDTPAATKLGAARTVLELAGLLGAGRKSGAEREPHEMSDDELRRSINRRQAELADRSKPLNVPQSDTQDESIIDSIG